MMGWTATACPVAAILFALLGACVAPREERFAQAMRAGLFGAFVGILADYVFQFAGIS